MNAKLFPNQPVVKLSSETCVQSSYPCMVIGDHYQLCSWNAIHYITAIDEWGFKVDETIGEPIDTRQEYARIHPDVQEEHIPSQMTSRAMTTAERKNCYQTMEKIAKGVPP